MRCATNDGLDLVRKRDVLVDTLGVRMREDRGDDPHFSTGFRRLSSIGLGIVTGTFFVRLKVATFLNEISCNRNNSQYHVELRTS